MMQYLIYFKCYIIKAMKKHADLMIQANELQIILNHKLKFNTELWKQSAIMTLREDYLSFYRIKRNVSGMTTKVSIKT